MLPDDLELARLMVPLLERGQEALRVRLATLAVRARPVGALDVVTQADFAANALVCLRHVRRNPDSSLHILCEDGAVYALLQQLRDRR